LKPNLFHFATKELSQDAVIAWLLQWASPSNKVHDAELHACGQAFLHALLKTSDVDFTEPIEKVEVGRQWKNIDVWAKINDTQLLIIEDKTNSGRHSEQLTR
jgi:hypothetical protein